MNSVPTNDKYVPTKAGFEPARGPPCHLVRNIALLFQWLTILEDIKAPLVNSVDTIRWNCHKSYLIALGDQGNDGIIERLIPLRYKT